MTGILTDMLKDWRVPPDVAQDILAAADKIASLERENERLRAALRVVPGRVTEEDRQWAIDATITRLERERDVLREALEKIANTYDDSWRAGSQERSIGDLARAALEAKP